jgi:antitoxin component YwqK of YwqJK toxin-antitoxin module
MIFQLDKNRDTLSIENYQVGLSHGVFKRFYPKNIVFEKRSYYKGSKEGVHLGYWKNGSLAFAYNLKNDIYHGTLKEWTKSGQIIKSLNYINGQEFGHQQLWYDNGEIRSNYIIKNNRRYGLLGTKNCVNVSDSIQ